jgi:uncharacterized protein
MILVVSIILGLYVLIALVIGRQLVYNDVFPKEKPDKSDTLSGYNFKYVGFLNPQKKKLRGWFIESKNNPTNRTLIILHGWTRTRLTYIKQIKFFADSGYHILAYDQIAHGNSELGLITFGESEGLDLLEAVSFLKTIPVVNQDKIAVVGFSLGTAAAIFAIASSDEKIFKAAVLEGAFANSYDVGEYMLVRKYGNFWGKVIGHAFFTFGSALWSLGKFKHANTSEMIAKIKTTPMLIIRGENDALVPDKSFKKLITSLNPYSDIWIHENGHHTRSYTVYPVEYSKRVLSFLEKHI